MLPIATIGPNEILIIVVVFLLLFGHKKIPEFGKSLAEGIHEFRKASKKIKEEDKPEEEKK